MPAPKGNKNAAGNRGGGRKSKYKPEYAEIAKRACAEFGYTDSQLATLFGVTQRTIDQWKLDFVEFASLRVDKTVADQRVEESLYHRALGYSHDAVKIFHPAGADAPVYAPYREHFPPDPQACIFWLKNRRPDLWRDVSRHEVDPIRLLVEGLTDDELARVAAGGSPGSSAAPKGSKEPG